MRTGWRRPSDRRATRAYLQTAAGVHDLEIQATHALSGALHVVAERARQGESLRGWLSEITRARNLFVRADNARRALAPLQHAELVRLRAETLP